MNKTIMAVILVVMPFLAGCQDKFEKKYDLSVDSYEYTLSAEGESIHLYVYCSGEWTAEFDVEQEWIRILPGTEKGSGIGLVRLEADYNDVAARAVNLILNSGEFTRTVHISQKYDSTHWVIQ